MSTWCPAGPVGMPERFPHDSHGLAQLFRQPHGPRAAMERIDAADGQQPESPITRHQHAEAVAADELPPFIGDRISGSPQIDAAMEGLAKLVESPPLLQTLAQFAELAAALLVGDQLADRFKVLHVPGLDLGAGAGMLEDLEHAGNFAFDNPRTDDKQVRRRVGCAGVCGRRTARRKNSRLAGFQHQFDKLPALDLFFARPNLGRQNLIGELGLFARGADPQSGPHGLEPAHHRIDGLGVKLPLRGIRFR